MQSPQAALHTCRRGCLRELPVGQRGVCAVAAGREAKACANVSNRFASDCSLMKIIADDHSVPAPIQTTRNAERATNQLPIRRRRGLIPLPTPTIPPSLACTIPTCRRTCRLTPAILPCPPRGCSKVDSKPAAAPSLATPSLSSALHHHQHLSRKMKLHPNSRIFNTARIPRLLR